MQLRHHPLRGAIFESLVAEVLLAELGSAVVLLEAKSGATVAGDMLRPLHRLADAVRAAGEERPLDLRLVYGGTASSRRENVSITTWSDVQALDRR